MVVVVYSPDGVPDDWCRSERSVQAAGIPGVEVIADAGETERRRFGVRTSGQVLVYDGSGRVAFRGGITAGRGHGGPNPGRAAVPAVLNGVAGAGREAAVFGCSLVNPSAPEGR